MPRGTAPASSTQTIRGRASSNQFPTPNSSEDSWASSGVQSILGNMPVPSPKTQSYVSGRVDPSHWFAELAEPDLAFAHEDWSCFNGGDLPEMSTEMEYDLEGASNITGYNGAESSLQPPTSKPRNLQQESKSRSKNAEHTMTAEECDCQLSQLSIDLCHYISKAEQLRMHHESSPDSAPANTCQSVSEAVGKALESNSRFISLIQDFTKCDMAQVPDNDGSRFLNDQDTTSPLRFPCLLNILSTYLRLVVLVDKLFQRLRGSILAERSTLAVPPVGSSTSSHGFQLLPGLQLAGFSVVQGSFQIRILIEALQHQFEIMETQLGLPRRLRVSNRTDDVGGSGSSGSSKFKLPEALQDPQHGVAVLMGLEGNTRADHVGTREARADVGRDPTVASLRSSIGEVQGLLGIH